MRSFGSDWFVEWDLALAVLGAAVFEDLPKCQHKRLLVVDAGIATQEQFAAATEQDAKVWRLRINGKLRGAPPAPQGKRKPGRPPKHGDVLHPGFEFPEVDPIEDFIERKEEKEIRVRRWNHLHFEDASWDHFRRSQSRPSWLWASSPDWHSCSWANNRGVTPRLSSSLSSRN